MNNIFDTLRYIELETISSCTRTCPWCLFGQYPDFRPSEDQLLETEYIEQLFHDLKNNNFQGTIGLFSINEPLLDPRIRNGQLLKLCRDILGEEININITTNGDLLNSSILDTLFSNGLNLLKISCYDNFTYEQMLRLTSQYSGIQVLDQTRYNLGNYESNRGGSLCGSIKKNLGYSSCSYPLYRSAIGWNGNIRICYNNILEDIVLGNIHEQLFSETMNSNHAKNIRQTITTQRNTIFPCNQCNVEGKPLIIKQIK